MTTHTIIISTSRRSEFIDITDEVQELITSSGVKSGICHVYTPHTTAGIIINEHADPDVIHDISKTLGTLIPWSDGYDHSEGNSAAHIKASLTGTSQTIFIENGRLKLGTWQGIFFGEFDGPRRREVWVKIS